MQDITSFIWEQLSKNEFFQGGFVLGILAAIGLYLRKIPIWIWDRIKRKFIYSVTVDESMGNLFMITDKWISENYPEKLRYVEARLVTGESDLDESNYPTVSSNEIPEWNPRIIYSHYDSTIYVRRGWRFISISKFREKLENANNRRDLYVRKITITGIFSSKVIRDIFNDAIHYLPVPKPQTLRRYFPRGWDWAAQELDGTKSVEQIFFQNKDEVLRDVDRFLLNKTWYEKRSIRYKRAYLFEGPPGSGKTSFAMALARYTRRPIFTFNLAATKQSDFLHLLPSITPKSILLFDDGDIAMTGREGAAVDTLGDSRVELSTLLGFLDGPDSREDIIIIMTANDISKLDPALLRKGRFDKIVHIGFPRSRDIQDYLELFYEVSLKIPITISDIPMSELQDICLRNDTVEGAVRELYGQRKNGHNHEDFMEMIDSGLISTHG